MKSTNNNVWSSAEQLNNESAYIQSLNQEFFELPIVDALGNEEAMIDTTTNRRDFLKFLGFGIGAATVAAGCQIPVKKAIPYVVRPDELVPGIANYYASAFVDGGDFVPVLVKTREGRPIKVESNTMCKMTGGGTSARSQAMVLSLYDKNRIRKPGKVAAKFAEMEWTALDKEIKGKIASATALRIVTNTVISPSMRRAIAEFTAKYPTAKHVEYDPISVSGLLDANAASFGKRTIPTYHFGQADVIVSFAADFLGTWISPVQYAADYSKNRKIAKDVKEAKMSRHYQFEAMMSLTGSNADHRTPIKPSEIGAATLALYTAVTGEGGYKLAGKAQKAIDSAANDLKAAAGKSLVVSGSNDANEQIIINAINAKLGNVGTTVDFGAFSNQRQGSDAAIQAAVKEGDAFIFINCNPVYDLPNGKELAAKLKSAKLAVTISVAPNETGAASQYLAPDHHTLESWGDAEPKNGLYALQQPTIAPLFSTRQAAHSLLVWADSANLNAKSEQPYYDYVQKTAEGKMAGSKFNKFQAFWETTLHDGLVEQEIAASGASFSGNVSDEASKIAKPQSGVEITFYESVAMGAGQHANNPWLQEMPDPVTRCVWGNHIAIPMEWDEASKAFQGKDGLKDGDLATITVGKETLTLPVVRQFG